MVQSHRNIEIVFVAQGDEQIDAVIKPFESTLNIRAVRIEKFGISRARNVGAELITGDIVAFPDDDCLYKSDTVQNVVEYFNRDNCDVLIGAVYDPVSLEPFSRYPATKIKMTVRKLWGLAPSISIFLNTEIFRKICGFDENFGFGGKYESAEETDLLFRIMESFPNTHLLLDPTIEIYHKKQNRSSKPFSERTDRAFKMNRGQGALVRKHLKYNALYWITKLASLIVRKFFGLLYYGVLRFDAKAIIYYGRSCYGLLIGFVDYGRCQK